MAEGRISRRTFVYGAGAAAGAGVGGRLAWHYLEGFERAATCVAAVPRYEAALLVDGIRRALGTLGFERARCAGKTVLLKPNLVEPSSQAPHVNTHPTFVRAVAEVFRAWDAAEVLVAEGQGHVRDSHLVLEQSGFGAMLDEARLPFFDLNHDDVLVAQNPLGLSRLGPLQLPRTLARADLIVSLPKMKTHHWAGATLSMKNLFGVMPGIVYGWPKNVLHHAGLGEAIVDISATVRPQLAIVDGIIGMEGDGPIMGRAKPMGVIVAGENLAAVDATAARLMGLDPLRLHYLALASGRLGPVRESHIEQRGEALGRLTKRFELRDAATTARYRSG